MTDRLREYINSYDIELVRLGVSIITGSHPKKEWARQLYMVLEGSFNSQPNTISAYKDNGDCIVFIIGDDEMTVSKLESWTTTSTTFSTTINPTYTYNYTGNSLQLVCNAVTTTGTPTTIFRGSGDGTTGSYSYYSSVSTNGLGEDLISIQPIPEVDVGDR
jgi:hypothetical protein